VTLSKRVALLLPRGRTTEVECASGDLSISAALVASRGDWEPHVRHYLETLVRPDWVCIDIGANIGAHTLSLASLAHNGRVVAFEADAANFELLQGNVRTLAPPSATIETVHAALWDDKCTLICGGADELAGCSFVGDDMANSALVERRLRSVVHSSEVDRTAFHIRLHEVAALPLDAWLEDNPLPRLDLIKLDVEGAEVRVIRGAETTLRLHRPVLLVEYNPACAEAYFGQSPDVLFRELEARFDVVNALEPDGRSTPIADWAALQARLAAGKGWEDLVCLPGPW
jgi:FkbM family methyltransferase